MNPKEDRFKIPGFAASPPHFTYYVHLYIIRELCEGYTPNANVGAPCRAARILISPPSPAPAATYLSSGMPLSISQQIYLAQHSQWHKVIFARVGSPESRVLRQINHRKLAILWLDKVALASGMNRDKDRCNVHF